MKRAIFATICLFWIATCVAAGAVPFPETILHAHQLKWMPVEQIERITGNVPLQVNGSRTRIEAGETLHIPLEQGWWYRIEPKGGPEVGWKFHYRFGENAAAALMDCNEVLTTERAWLLESHLDGAYLAVTAPEHRVLRLLRAKWELRKDFWGALTAEAFGWIEKDRFVENALSYLRQIEPSHPATGPIGQAVAKIPNGFESSVADKQLRHSYLKALLLHTLTPYRLTDSGSLVAYRTYPPVDQAGTRARFEPGGLYAQGTHFVYEATGPAHLLLDTRVLYSPASLHDLRRYRIEVRVNGRLRKVALEMTIPSRERSGPNGEIVGVPNRAVIPLGPGERLVEINASTPIWCRLGKPASRPPVATFMLGKTSLRYYIERFFSKAATFPASPELSLAAATLHNLNGDPGQAEKALAPLVGPGAATIPNKLLALQASLTKAEALMQKAGFGDSTRENAGESLLEPVWRSVLDETAFTLFSQGDDNPAYLMRNAGASLDKIDPLNFYQRLAVQVRILNLQSQLAILKGENAGAAAALASSAASGKADRDLLDTYLAAQLHSSAQQPAPWSLPGVFEQALEPARSDNDRQKLIGLRGRFLRWRSILHSAEAVTHPAIFFDRVTYSPDAAGMAALYDRTALFYETAPGLGFTLDNSAGGSIENPAPVEVRGALLGPFDEATVTLSLDGSDPTMIDIQGRNREFKFTTHGKNPSAVLSIAGIDNNAASQTTLLIDQPPTPDRLRVPADPVLARFARRLYEQLPEKGLEYAFSTEGSRTGVRLLFRTRDRIESSLRTLTVTLDGIESKLRLVCPEGIGNDPSTALEARYFVGPGNHFITVRPEDFEPFEQGYVQVAIESPRSDLHELETRVQ
jgi:hypothetical protein